MYLASSMTNESIVQIGKKLGGRNHATIIHAISNIRSLSTTDKQTRQDVETLKWLINSK
jgi:chromosomal replication initiator protein